MNREKYKEIYDKIRTEDRENYLKLHRDYKKAMNIAHGKEQNSLVSLKEESTPESWAISREFIILQMKSSQKLLNDIDDLTRVYNEENQSKNE